MYVQSPTVVEDVDRHRMNENVVHLEETGIANNGTSSSIDVRSSIGSILRGFLIGKNEKMSSETVNLPSLMRYAQPFDVFCMVLASLAAFAHGATLPLFILISGNLMNAFTNRAGTLCSLNFTALSQEYCPAGVELDSINWYFSMLKCNFTGFNLTGLNFDLKGAVKIETNYFVAIGCATIVLGYVQAAFWGMSAERQTRTIRRILFRSIIHKEMTYFDIHNTGELNTQLTDNVNKIHDGIGDKVGVVIQYMASCMVGFIIGFVKGWKLTLVVLALSPLVFLSIGLFSKVLNHVTTIELKAYERAGTVAEEVFSSIRTVFAYNGQEQEKKRYEKYLAIAKDEGIKKGIFTGLTMGFVLLVIKCGFALGFWYGAKLIRDDEYKVGTVFIVFFSIFDGIFKIGQAGQHFQAITEARVAAYAVWQVINTLCKIESDSETGVKKDHLIGDIEFTNVRFHYPSRPTCEVLNGISFNVKHGETVAIVGSSGSGKSTCIQLLQRFYDPDSGSIIIDDHQVNQYNLRWLRQQIGVVSQESVLFSTSIRENILLGRETATDEEIYQAAKMANAHDFIMTLPEKYNTLVGERGAALSGGQKQRIAIARALIRNPRILLLDEATSALDNESEKIVQDALNRATEGRTTIVIAHRLSTIRNADKIIVMHNGEIVEEGNHDSLMGALSTYYNLVQQQKLHKTEEEEVQEQENDDILLSNRKYEHRLSCGRARASTVVSLTLSGFVSIYDKHVNPDDNNDDELKKKEKTIMPNVTLSMMKMNKPEWLWIVIGCLACICNGSAQPTFGIVLSKLLSVFQICDKDEQERQVLLYILLFVAFGIVGLIALFLQNYMFACSGEALTERLRSEAFQAILRQDVSFFDDPQNSTGALCTRLSSEASSVRGATGIRIGLICENIFSFGIGVILSFIFSWQLTLAILGFVPLLITGVLLQNRLMTRFAKNDRQAHEDTGKISVESFQNIRTVVQLTKEDYFYEKYSQLLNIPFRSSMIQVHVVGVLFSLSNSVMHFLGAVISSFGAFLVEQNTITLEDVLIVILCILYGARHIGQTISMAPNYGKAVNAAENILRLLARKPTIDNGLNDGDKISNFNGQIELNGVYFVYPTRSEAIVLKNINLKIKTGQKVAFVGQSGCGKSTMIQMIERFYDASIGCVLADSKDIRSLNVQWYRSQFGIVLQEPVLFDMSIRENIAYGDTNRNDISIDEIIKAAQDANIHDFIQQLPDGYETNCGAKGLQLSGGQKQRIAIARALIRNPKILLLDEATSALDSESEKIVQETLDQAQQNRTSITIAHRLSTIQNADVIYVMHHGRIVETGTHQELLALGGQYYRLVQGKLK